MNKIFFMTLFFIKPSRLILGHDVRVLNGPAFKCPGPIENDHSKAGTARLSDAYSIIFQSGSPMLYPDLTEWNGCSGRQIDRLE
jgi:hypothetical protein